ncbi:NlpC/P60 family protein [Caldicellulosiruptoraceae bacterium PP1]
MKTKVFLFTTVLFALLMISSIIYASQQAEAKSTINIRSSANSNAKVIGVFPKGFTASVLGRQNGYVKISFEGKVGFVKEDYIQLKNKITTSKITKNTNENFSYNATVIKNNARLRKDKSTNSTILKSLTLGEKLTIISKDANGWLKVKTKDGVIGYIAYYLVKENNTSKILVSTNTTRTNITKTSRSLLDRSSMNKAYNVIEFAKKYLGVRYRYGGESPITGFDCSGFVQFVYRNFGINLERTAASMAYSNGIKISYSELQPGDLVFFDTDGGRNYINHVGIYIGGGEYIHASSARGQVSISNLTSKIGTAFMMAKRVLR